jgi:hypothetical protein
MVDPLWGVPGFKTLGLATSTGPFIHTRFVRRRHSATSSTCRGKSQINNYTSDVALAGLDPLYKEGHHRLVPRRSAVQLCQRSVGLENEARLCVEESQQAVLCVYNQLDGSDEAGVGRGVVRINRSSRGDLENKQPECDSVGFRVGMFQSNHHGHLLSCVRFFRSAHRLESSDGYTTLTSRLCLATSFVIVGLIQSTMVYRTVTITGGNLLRT